MALVLEDGTGIIDANSYATVQEFKDYHNDRGNDVSEFSDSDIARLLVRATDYVDQRWGMAFKGYKQFTCNTLSFPRKALVDKAGNTVEGVPEKLKQAVFIYALQAGDKDLFVDPELTVRSGITMERQRVGPIETETRYAESSASSLNSVESMIQPFPAADLLLQEYVLPGGRTIRA